MAEREEIDLCTSLAVGGGSSPPIETDWVSIRVTTVVPVFIVVSVDTVSRAVSVVVVAWAVPLVTDIEVDICATTAAIHVGVVV